MDRCTFAALTDPDLTLPVYVTCAGGWENQDPVDRPQGYPDYQWIQCVNGEGRLHVRGAAYTVAPGQGMLLYPNEAHRYEPVREPWTVRWVAFNGGLAGRLLAELQFLHSQVLHVSRPDRPLEQIGQIVNILESKEPLKGPACSARVYALLLDLRTSGSSSVARSQRQHLEQLAPALDYIEDHYAEELTLDALAGRIGLSPQYTCHLFRQALGMRPFEYVTGRRLRRAKELLLENPELPVQEVARRVGYEHPSYFIKLFKRTEGVTPNLFRRIHR